MFHHKTEIEKYKMTRELNENIFDRNDKYCNIITYFFVSALTLAIFILINNILFYSSPCNNGQPVVKTFIYL